MIPEITASAIYSVLGNNSSIVPLAIKDVANSCGLTMASYLAGDKVEGKDRFIDEFGTQAIWLWGIPSFNKLFDYALFKPAKIDCKIDARLLKNQDILKAAIKFAPNKTIQDSLKYAIQHQKQLKALTIAKFAASTVLTTLSYLGLTKFRHKYTENSIKKDYYEKQKGKDTSFGSAIPYSPAFSDVYFNKKNVSFTGGIQDFIFDPVKNLMLVDASITAERLTHSRNPQDFLGYVIKEGSFWLFMYFAGPLIAKSMEKCADKKGKSIDLDARVIFSDELKNSIKDGTLKKHIAQFKAADTNDLNIYEFAVNEKNNLVLDFAKKSDIIELFKNSDKVDTRRYIDLAKLRGVNTKLEKLLNYYESSGMDLDKFLSEVRKLKKLSVLGNIGACIGALGIIAPSVMLFLRKFDSDYQVKKDIESKLAQKG